MGGTGPLMQHRNAVLAVCTTGAEAWTLLFSKLLIPNVAANRAKVKVTAASFDFTCSLLNFSRCGADIAFSPLPPRLRV